MLYNNEARYQKIIQYLKDNDRQVSPSLSNSVCPKNTKIIINRFLDAGVEASDLTEAIADVFQYPLYNSKMHGEAKIACSEGEWLVAKADSSIFFIANPFRKVSPSHVLEKPIADKIRKIGLLPTAAKRFKKRVQEQSKVESERNIRQWLEEAHAKGATDIHITPLNGASIRISFRIDGQIVTYEDKHMDTITDDSLYQYISNTLLRMCDIEAGLFTKPVDGKFAYDEFEDGSSIEVRMAMRPLIAQGVKSQGFWLRILSAQSNYNFPSLDKIGLHKSTEALLHKMSQTNQKMILITGPTGSGKSTTLYSTLMTIQKEQKGKSIQTLEDPVEVHIDGIEQTQVQAEIGMGFAQGLRSLMRSDVDVILIGEIRDEETASLAIRASLTGHLVFATIHCKTSLEAIGRLLDFKVTPQLIANVLAASFAQRLVRRSCPECVYSVAYENAGQYMDTSKYSLLFAPGDMIAVETDDKTSCIKCSDGYKGRCVVSEALPITRGLNHAIIAEDFVKMAYNAQYEVTLWEHAALLIKSNQTTFQECLRTLPEYEIPLHAIDANEMEQNANMVNLEQH